MKGAALENLLIKLVNIYFAVIPRWTKPETLRKAKIIAHRGCHLADNLVENTIPAFDKALEMGVYGIEFDIRYSKEHVPVVFHDVDLRRIHQRSEKIHQLSLKELQSLGIPSLQEVINKYHHKLQLFIEIKSETDVLLEKDLLSIKSILKKLAPVEDFYLLSLKPELFKQFDFLPPTCFLPVSEWNYRDLFQLTLNQHYGGLTGHFLFLNQNICNQLKKNQLKVGTGQIASINCMKRELNRGVDYVFTNHPLKLQNYLKKYL